MKNVIQLVLFVAFILSCDSGKLTETVNDQLPTDSLQSLSEVNDSFVIEKIPSVISEIKIDSMPLLELVVDTTIADTTYFERFALVPDQLKSLGINEFDIPTEKEIGIKSYPESMVVKLGTPFEYKGKAYNTMELVSKDNPEQILEFYQKRKENWFYVFNSGVHTFKQNENEYFRATNNLQIQPFDFKKHPGIDSIFEFTPRSFIYIYYEIK